MTDQETIDQQVLAELRPPGGGPQSADEILLTLTRMRRHGVELPPISCQAIHSSLQRLAEKKQAAEQDGTWRFTPAGAARQGSLF